MESTVQLHVHIKHVTACAHVMHVHLRQLEATASLVRPCQATDKSALLKSLVGIMAVEEKYTPLVQYCTQYMCT